MMQKRSHCSEPLTTDMGIQDAGQTVVTKRKTLTIQTFSRINVLNVTARTAHRLEIVMKHLVVIAIQTNTVIKDFQTQLLVLSATRKNDPVGPLYLVPLCSNYEGLKAVPMNDLGVTPP